MDNRTLGQKIEYYRKRAKMSQLELELEINASQGSISRIENGQVNPTKETLRKIIEVLDLRGKEAAELFGLDVSEDLSPVIRAAYKVFDSLELDKVLQAIVDDIIYELKLLSGFIALVDGDKLFAKTSTNGWITKLAFKIIPVPFNQLHVSLTANRNNLMVRTVLESKSFIDDKLRNFIVPAVDMPMAILLEKVTGAKTCISFPISYNGKVIGAFMFGKDYIDDFSKEKGILEEYAKYIAIAIKNAEQYEELKSLQY